MWETGVRYLVRKHPLEKGMATHSSIPAWRIPWTEEPGGTTAHGVAKSWTRLSNTHTQEYIHSAARGACRVAGALLPGAGGLEGRQATLP